MKNATLNQENGSIKMTKEFQEMSITLDIVERKWKACYSASNSAELFATPKTPREVLTLTTGKWEEVSDKDRLWVVLHAGVLSNKSFRLFAADVAEQALLNERENGREPDVRSWAAIQGARNYANGIISKEELKVIKKAARVVVDIAYDNLISANSKAYAPSVVVSNATDIAAALGANFNVDASCAACAATYINAAQAADYANGNTYINNTEDQKPNIQMLLKYCK